MIREAPAAESSAKAATDARVPPDVDVVVVSWNVRDELERCLHSVLRSVGVRLHAIVVDNASIDGTAGLVAERFREVHLIRNASNEGFARAVNRGVAEGRSPYVLLLNPDTVVSRGAIITLLDRIEQLPTAAAITPRLVDENGRFQHSAHTFPSLRVSLLLASGAASLLSARLRSRLLLVGSWSGDTERTVPWAHGAVLLIKRATFERLGLLDERFFVYGEDIEWCDRAARSGLSIWFTPSVEVQHWANKSGTQRYGEDRVAAYMRSTIGFTRRRHGLVWTALFIAISAAEAIPRYALHRALARVRPTPDRLGRLNYWRAHVRFYLRRAHPPP